MVLFSIIAIYYQGVTTKEEFDRFIKSVEAQTFKDFELIVLHDGPKLYDVEYNNIIWSDIRLGLWGHPLRDKGIELAKGLYILHTNCDNLYYPNALQDMYDKIKQTKGEIIIGQVKMMGLNYDGHKIWYDTPRNYKNWVILIGRPPVFGNIDLMSLCASKRIWNKYNGWKDVRAQADGYIYTRMCYDTEPEYTNTVIGEHY